MSSTPEDQPQEEEERGFTISDRRTSRMEEEEKPAADAAKDENRQKEAEHLERERQRQQIPEINLSTFLLSLGSTALIQLGEIEDPATNVRVENLPHAKQTIDILGVLEEKTKGNLQEDETNLLANLLYDLRLRYVNKIKGGGAAAP